MGYDYVKLNANKFWRLQIDIINKVNKATAATKIKLTEINSKKISEYTEQKRICKLY